MPEELIIRIFTVCIFFLWTMYWLIAKISADREKPKTRKIPLFHRDNIGKLILYLVEMLLILQLVGLPFFQISNTGIGIQIIGLFLVIVGAVVAISARKTLGTNWAHAFEYQIKQKQELVTTGIYGYIRHPIYTGLVLGFIGGELVAKSYLALLGLVLIIGAYRQAKLEEKLLIKHLGEDYKNYMKRTKMFVPYSW